jgi:hypothetical protein
MKSIALGGFFGWARGQKIPRFIYVKSVLILRPGRDFAKSANFTLKFGLKFGYSLQSNV